MKISANYEIPDIHILTGFYGSCNPEVLLQRTNIAKERDTFIRENFVGVYELPHHEVFYQKLLSDGTAAANIKLVPNKTLNMFVWALPVQTLQSGALLRAEGAPRIGEHRMDAHYNLAPNVFALKELFQNPVFKEETILERKSIPAYSLYYFDAGKTFIRENIKPSKEYLLKIEKTTTLIGEIFPEVINLSNIK